LAATEAAAAAAAVRAAMHVGDPPEIGPVVAQRLGPEDAA